MGPSWPVPTWGQDYIGLADLSLEGYAPIIIESPIPLEILTASEALFP